LLPAIGGYATTVISLGQFFKPQTKDEITLAQTIYTRISLIAHSWKGEYLTLHPKGWDLVTDPATRNMSVWQVLIERVPPFTKEDWLRYKPLFFVRLENIRSELQGVLAAYGSQLPPSMKTAIENTRGQLTADYTLYYWLGRNIADDRMPADMANMMFRSALIGAFQTLGALATEAERLRDSK